MHGSEEKRLTDGEIVSSVSLILLHDEESDSQLPVAGTLEIKGRVQEADTRRFTFGTQR